MDFKFRHSVAPIKEIESIQFSVLSPQFIENTSVTNEFIDENGNKIKGGVYNSNGAYDSVTKKAIYGGINDIRMGNINDPENPGFHGHMKLSLPVFHYCFLNTIISILRCISFYNSKLLISPTELSYISSKKKKRLQEILKISQKIKICPYTKQSQPTFLKDSLKIRMTLNNVESILSPSDVYTIFEKISDEDTTNLGLNPKFSRPEWLLIKTLLVPPCQVRPTVSMNVLQKCEDDLTRKLIDILKSNIALEKAIQKHDTDPTIEGFENLLQYNIASFFDNKIPGQKPSQQRSGKPLKTITQRLVGKEGRVRGNLMGKRVDFSARTVITADPGLSMDQVGVPVSIAINLTIPEKVTEYNINRLQKLVNNGPGIHPGVKYITTNTGQNIKKVDLNFVKESPQLEIGQVVDRHIDNDDIILFNRQPSLHKMSIMAHKVKIQRGKTFRLNLSVTTPYNADFDGDEMNLHVPQSQTAIAEAEMLMSVQNMIVSPQSNKPVMGIIQDSLLTASIMTHKSIFLNEHTFLKGIYPIFDTPKVRDIIGCPAVILNLNGQIEKLWTGKQYFSTCLNNKINFKRNSNRSNNKQENINEYMDPNDYKVLILNGYLLSGNIDKKTIGTSEGSLIHILFLDRGPNETMTFMNNIQKITNFWILKYGFTIGITDMIIPNYDHIKNILKNVKTTVSEMGLSDGNPKLESEINSELNSARDEAGNYVQSLLHFNNNFKTMVLAGSKGNNLNISQVIACLGQQNIEGARVGYGFSKRTLPHYEIGELNYECRGFIENSYISGLGPQEFFFHAMAGREGIIDTACKTSETGYTQRRVVKSLEDVTIKYDYTVRDSNNNIIQFIYGDDGFDAVFVESQEIPLMLMSDKDIMYNYQHPPEFLSKFSEEDRILFTEELNDIFSARKLFRKVANFKDKPTENIFHIPVNIKRIIDNLKELIPINFNELYLIKEVKNLINILKPNKLFIAYIKSICSSKMIRTLLGPNKNNLNSDSDLHSHSDFNIIDLIIDEIRVKYISSIVSPGEMIGIIAAQSMSELTTQLTLNSFHSSGISAKNITLGLPRLKELINVSKKIKSSSMTIYPKKDIFIENNTFKNFIKESYILNRTTDSDPIINMIISFYNDLLSKYYLKIKINDKLLEYTGITMKDIVLKIQEGNTYSNSVFYCTYDEDPYVYVFHLNSTEEDLHGDLTEDSLSEESTEEIYENAFSEEEEEEKIILNYETELNNNDDDNDGFTLEEEEEYIVGYILKEIEISFLNKIIITGISGINKIFYEDKIIYQESPEGTLNPEKIKIISTEGSNLKKIFEIPNIDNTKTITNNILEIYEVLGIEAARQALLNELRMVLSFDGSYINYHHLTIIVDIMTHKGQLMPLTRHGLNKKTDSSTLMKCSFEETMDILTDAAIFSQKDHIRGVSENIMLGQLAACGTGTFDVYYGT